MSNTMTTDEIRADLYRMTHPGCDPYNIAQVYPLTLDGAAAAMPEGFKWERRGHLIAREHRIEVRWQAWNHDRGWDVTVPDTSDEIHDRYALARACLMAERGVQ
jgi:hypothetical protein